MTRPTCRAAIVSLLFVACANAAPSMDDIRRAYDAGDYHKTLTLISQALADKNADVDRYELLMRRGDALLHRNIRASAIQAFEDAASSTDDSGKKAWARGMTILTKSGVKADENRKEAMERLFVSMSDKMDARVEKAQNETTLPPLEKVFRDLLDLGAVEFAARGEIAVSKAYIERLGERALELVDREIRRLSLRAAELRSLGNDIVITGRDEISRRGYHTNDQRELESLREYARKIESLARDARTAAREIGFTGEKWNNTYGNAAELVDRIDAMLGL
jgi:hypothetical protein